MIDNSFGKSDWADYEKDLKISWVKNKPFKYHNKMVYCYVRLSGLEGNLVKGYRMVLQKCHVNTQKWPKMNFLTQKSPQMTFFDLKTSFLTEKRAFSPENWFFAPLKLTF